MDIPWAIILSSTVVAAIISGIVSLAVSRLQHKDTLNLNRYSRKWDLSIEAFKNLQAALIQIDTAEDTLHCDNPEDDITSALTTMFARSKKKMEVTKSTLDQISYLIPRKKVEYLISEHDKLEKSYLVLLASAYNLKGIPRSQIKVDVVPEGELPIQMQKYIDCTQEFLDNLKNEIINALRELFGTQ